MKISALLIAGMLAAGATACARPEPVSPPSPAAPVAGTAAAPAPSPADLAGVKPRPFDRRMSAELSAYVADFMRRAEVPGVAVALVQGGRTVYAQGFGVRELGKPGLVTPETLMMIGSTGKSMTTMMMATLVDEGRIAWDTPAVEVYPDFAVSDPALTPRITLRHTVCNCAGLERHDLEMYFARERPTADEVVRWVRNIPFVGELGKTFGYVNQMVAAGGYIAARAARGTGDDLYASYLAQMQQRVFDPIGMASTTFSFARAEADPDHASPHAQTGSYDYVPISTDLEEPLAPIAPAGASWSNARDVALYLATQLSQGIAPSGRRVVSRENLTATWQPQVEIQPGFEYGLGWAIARYKGQRLLTHGGGTSGFTSDLSFLPEAGLGIAVLTNAQNANFLCSAVRSRILELAFGQPMEMDAVISARQEQARRRFRDRLPRLQPAAPATLAPYLGSYTNPALGQVELGLAGGELRLTAATFTTGLRSLGGGTWVVWDPPLAGALVRFSAEDPGRPAFVLDADDPDVPDKYRFTKASASGPHPAAEEGKAWPLPRPRDGQAGPSAPTAPPAPASGAPAPPA